MDDLQGLATKLIQHGLQCPPAESFPTGDQGQPQREPELARLLGVYFASARFGFGSCAKTLHGIRANDPPEPYLQRANSGLLTDGHFTLQRLSDLAVCDAPNMEV
jgi:hypothetical protein